MSSTPSFALWVTALKADSTRRRKWARRTNARASFSWPTATASADKQGTHPHPDPKAGRALVTTARSIWPTPTTDEQDSPTPRPSRTGLQTEYLGKTVAKWPTPLGTERGDCPSEQARHTPDLRSQAATWPTPQARDETSPDAPESGNWRRKEEAGYAIDLNSLTAAWVPPPNWRTPTTTDTGVPPDHLTTKDGQPPTLGVRLYREDGQGGRINNTVTLEAQIGIWPTPRAADFRSGEVSDATLAKNARPLTEAATRWAYHTSLPDPQSATPGRLFSLVPPASPPPSPTPPSAKRRLNPRFVEWLMGLPRDWTDPTTPTTRAQFDHWRAASASMLSAMGWCPCKPPTPSSTSSAATTMEPDAWPT